MLIMAIESSCDETACSFVENGVTEIASSLATSEKLHHATGGIVPEVAARKQAEFIIPVIDLAQTKAAEFYGVSKEDLVSKIDAIAVTMGPGLIGSLVVGVEAAKALALAWNKPIIPVNHLLGHLYANFLGLESAEIFPAVGLVVSGGHTDLVFIKKHGDIEYLGGTIDDAAGEAFDKVARLLGFGMYLGGANLSKAAQNYTGESIAEKLPRSFVHTNDYDFSFSGLKTAVKRLLDKGVYPVSAIAQEFENAVVEVLVEKTIRAVKSTKARSLLLGGGVSANRKLRQDLYQRCTVELPSIEVRIPPLSLCTDNAIYIASAAFFNQSYRKFDQIHPNPSLTIKDRT